MNNRKVKIAWMQSPLDLPSFPGATTQFSPSKTPNARMELTSLGLEISQGDVKAFIPMPNIKAVVFETEKV